MAIQSGDNPRIVEQKLAGSSAEPRLSAESKAA